MSKYGIDYYGLAYYGPKSDVSYQAYPMVATPVDYNKIVVSWTTPSGMWDLMRLSRNPYGFPLTPDDGDVLFEDVNGSNRLPFFADNGTIPTEGAFQPGHPYYYSLFVRQTVSQNWIQAGTAIGICIKDFNTVNMMDSHLPAVLRSQVPYNSDLNQNNPLLSRFLKIFAVQHDLYKSQVENLMNRYDVENVNGQLIPVFLNQFGSSYEPEIGLKQARIFLRNLSRLYQSKGSRAGVENYVKAFVGYDNNVYMGKNLFLSTDDASFEQSVGYWEATVGTPTLAIHTASSTPTMLAYVEPTSSLRFPNKRDACLSVVSDATSRLYNGHSNPVFKGIPVVSGQDYTFSFYVAKESTQTGNAGADIRWFTSTGELITVPGEILGTSIMTNSWARRTRTETAPANAAYACPGILIEGTTAGKKMFIDACQFEKSSTATEFEDARKIHIDLVASRINELLNPNFEQTVDHWTVTNGHLILAGSEVGQPPGYIDTEPISDNAGELYADGAGLVTMASSSMNISPSNDYTFSIYCASVILGANFAVTPFISWYTQANVLISTVNGTPVTTSADYKRPYVTATAPNNAAHAKVGVTFIGTGPTNEIAVDAALFEKSSGLNTFFDGNHGFAEQSDVLWEGGNTLATVNHARSHYYKNRYSSQERLVGTLDDWLTLGSTFELYFALPSE